MNEVFNDLRNYFANISVEGREHDEFLNSVRRIMTQYYPELFPEILELPEYHFDSDSRLILNTLPLDILQRAIEQKGITFN